jgi:glycosyltransferase involved in cell wall biosynthesis
MAGIIQDQNYHNEQVAPALDDVSVVYLGPVGGAVRAKTLSARALLHLINFDEPFGLSVVEALACGTPVIACNRGSMPELIDDGVTGFLVDSFDAAVDAIDRIGEIDRAACRAAVSARFTVDLMADRYLRLYRSILGREPVFARSLRPK